MNQEQFEELIKRWEKLARQQPVTYKFRVGLLAALGYAYIFLILASLLAILAAIVLLVFYSGRFSIAIIKLGILLLIPTFIVLGSLWVQFPPPTGWELNRKQVPRLFDLVDELTSKLQAPKFHRLLMTGEFNAAVVQIPRLGIFGWQQNTAEALVNVEVKARFLQSSFWASIYKQIAHQVEPPQETYTKMLSVLGTQVNSPEATRWLDDALAQKTNNADTHPCLKDRLSALGYLPAEGQPLIPPAVTVSAAREFLGYALNQLTTHFDQNWKEQIATPWRQRYAYTQEAQKNLQLLEQKAENQSLSAEEAWNRASWTAEFQGNEAALPLFREMLMTQPEHPAANYALGEILLQQKDAAGIFHIEKAMEILENVIPGCELIYAFWMQQGKVEKAKAYQQRAEKHYDLAQMAQQERSTVHEHDRFGPHNLPDEIVQLVCQQRY